jgi:hypothetical protein
MRQESHRRAADDHLYPSTKKGSDWPVIAVNRPEIPPIHQLGILVRCLFLRCLSLKEENHMPITSVAIFSLIARRVASTRCVATGKDHAASPPESETGTGAAASTCRAWVPSFAGVDRRTARSVGRALGPRSARTRRSVPPYQTGVAAQGPRSVQHLRLSVIRRSGGAGDR